MNSNHARQGSAGMRFLMVASLVAALVCAAGILVVQFQEWQHYRAPESAWPGPGSGAPLKPLTPVAEPLVPAPSSTPAPLPPLEPPAAAPAPTAEPPPAASTPATPPAAPEPAASAPATPPAAIETPAAAPEPDAAPATPAAAAPAVPAGSTPAEPAKEPGEMKLDPSIFS